MNIEINRGTKENKVIVSGRQEDKIKSKQYEFTMIAENDISVFLPFRKRLYEGEELYEYNISGMTSIYDLAKRKSLGFRELVLLVNSLDECKIAIDEYLLSEEGLIVDPEYIFFDRRNNEIKYCFYPFSDNDLFSSFSMLGEFLLSDIDYDDEDAVKLAYDIYASILNKDYDFIRLIPDKKIDEGLIKDKMHDNEYEIEDISINKKASEGTEKSEREGIAIPKMNMVAIVCLTIVTCIFMSMMILFLWSKRLFVYIFSDIKVISLTILILCLLLYFPLMNISDINRAKRLRRMVQKTC